MMDQWVCAYERVLRHYRMHLLIVIIALLISLTFAHPSLLVTDELVTVNQLSQLHDGHQIIYNEGKYGSFENGTPTPYFVAKQNLLAYPLFLPVISLPAYGLIDIFGNDFVFFILYLWTFLFLALALILNAFFPEWTYAGKWRWTNWLIGLTFVVFFINLFFYKSFPLMATTDSPEIVAIVFTNIILFAALAVMVYEICRTIFEDTGYAFFATLTCISCSSYLFWTNFCKDHVLAAFLVTAIILLLIKLFYDENILFLLGVFTVTGILAWARPEMALPIAVTLCILVVYILYRAKKIFPVKKDRFIILLSPFCTLIGAIPFFINNYIINNNIFIPPNVRWDTGFSSTIGVSSSAISVHQNTSGTSGLIFHMIQMGTNINPSTFLSDLYGVLFNPQNGSMGVLPLTPIFLIAVLLIPLFVLDRNLKFTTREQQCVIILALVSLGVFFAYFRGITGMNSSLGMVPDMRYFSPLYLPLTLIGLLMIRKIIPEITAKPIKLIQWMLVFWIFLIPVSVIGVSKYFPLGEDWEVVNITMNFIASIAIYLIVAMFLICSIYFYVFNKSGTLVMILLALVCSLPLVWQIDTSFVARLFGIGLGGYTLWIPVVFKSFELIFGYNFFVQYAFS